MRGGIIAVAVIVLAASAGAQPCAVNVASSTVNTLRIEGLTDLVGDVVMACANTGGAAGLATLTLNLNTNITSRLLGLYGKRLLRKRFY